MFDGASVDYSPGYAAFSNAFPALDELFVACERNIAAVDDGDYLLDSSFRESYLRYNANNRVYVNLSIFNYSVSIERSKGSAVLVASQPFREASEAVPYFKAIEHYKRFLIACLKDNGYQTKKILDSLLDAVRKQGAFNGSEETGARYDKRDFLAYFENAVRKDYPSFSPEDVSVAANRVFRFMTDYDWWGGAKCLCRDDYFISPVLSMLGKAAASGEIYAFIVRDYDADSALYNAARNLKLVDRTDADRHANRSSCSKRLETGSNVMIYGAPGTGKSWFIKHKLYKNAKLIPTVFHPEYSYFDFVGSYKPVPVYITTQDKVMDSDGVGMSLPGKPVIDYRFVPGPFIDAVIDAYDHPAREYCLVIDEINRASAAAVFGDMFQLLDRKEDHQSEYSIKPQADLAKYLRSAGYEELASSFYIPSNLSIAATMNNADLGVTYLDTAFKRRWSFTYIPIDLAENAALMEFVNYNKTSRTLREIISAINDKLHALRINEDRWIGPFFVAPQEIKIRGAKEALKKIAMYLWDDVFRNDRSRFFEPTIDSLSEVERTIGSGDPLLLAEMLDRDVKEADVMAEAGLASTGSEMFTGE